nr:kinesin-like protein klpa [Quercus suber]
MERPSSALENHRPSGLKQPSKLPSIVSSSAGRTLVETSQSNLNARNGSGPMAPPISVYKHKMGFPPEPQPPTKQRKTLAERAAEPLNPTRSHIPAKSSSMSRSESTSASMNSRGFGHATSNFRQHGSTASTSSLNGTRPQSRQRYVGHRPASNIEYAPLPTEEDPDAAALDNPKGTHIPHLSTITIRKTRNQEASHRPLQVANSRIRFEQSRARSGNGDVYESSDSEQSSRTTSLSSTTNIPQQEPVGQSLRNFSLISALDKFHISPPLEPSSRSQSVMRHRPSLESIKEVVSPSKIPKYSCPPALRQTQSLQTVSTQTPVKHKSSNNGLRTPLTSTRRKPEPKVFLTKDMLTPMPAWDTQRRLDDFVSSLNISTPLGKAERRQDKLFSQMATQINSNNGLQESLDLHKIRGNHALLFGPFPTDISTVHDLQEANSKLTSMNSELTLSNKALAADIDRARNDIHTITSDLKQSRRDHDREIADAERRHDRALNDTVAKQEREVMRLQLERERDVDRSAKEMNEAKEKWRKEKDNETADLTTQHWEELDQLRGDHEREKVALQKQVDDLRQSGESRATETADEVQRLREEMATVQKQLEAANATTTSLRARVASEQTRNTALEQEKAGLVSKTHFLEGNQEAQSLEFTTMREQLQEATASRESTLEMLRKEEVLRRKLNAQILELRGNIRVFVRTRPLLNGEDDPAKVDYPDGDSLDGGKEMIVHAPTTLTAAGKERNEKHNYSFDRAFGPGTPNTQVFRDCRDLIQSVVDGYNVSILSYGQTGSGKTYGMSGPEGIIPSAIALLLSEMQRLSIKGWEYTVAASFVEVYNETLNDLLGDAKTWDDDDETSVGARGKKKEKHEIRHDPITGKTTVTNLSSVMLWPPPEDDGQSPAAVPMSSSAEDTSEAAAYTERAVTSLLDTAAKNRRVAATKANERSSRSHSIFILTLRGRCDATGENSEGILNLVDLAGSERLKQSGAEGNRMKETQAINKSLSSLGDVIAALGSKGGNDSHIPYRNSKVRHQHHPFLPCPPPCTAHTDL